MQVRWPSCNAAEPALHLIKSEYAVEVIQGIRLAEGD